jgi:ATP-dependent Clp protease ATP-binding subunit ClpA
MFSQNPEIDTIIQESTQLARDLNHSYVTVEHVTLSLVNHKPFKELLIKFGADVDSLRKDLEDYLLTRDELVVENSGPELKKTNSLERIFNRSITQVIFSGRQQVQTIDLFLSISYETTSHASYFIAKHGIDRNKLVKLYNKEYNFREAKEAAQETKGNAVLDEHCINYSRLFQENKIDPVIGRDDDIQSMVENLCRRNKSNILLVGDPGVGKTSLVEGLVSAIEEIRVPKYLRGYTVYGLDIGSILAGTKYRGDFEEKIKEIIAALIKKKKCILFVDEAHQMRGAGSNSNGGVDFANMIKPALSKGQIKVIASTTWEEYTQSFEKDRALMRRFHRLSVSEPTPAVAKQILEGLRDTFEEYHEGGISNEAINAAVELSVRYQSDKKLPDKAIDLIDSACARVKIARTNWILDEEDIKKSLSVFTGIPTDQLSYKNKESNITELEPKIKARLYSQDSAVETVLEKIYIAKAGLKESDKPMGCFLFLGPTGCGKSELAKLLAENLGMKMIRFDMSEYQERHAVSKLIGSPPGYVGYEDSNLGGGLLISNIEKNPHSVILFDEIEKAHPDISNVLLQLMDEGFVTGSNGKRADARNCIVILTSNLGAQDMERNSIGFTKNDRADVQDSAVKDYFRPEFRNRLDAICRFQQLKKADLELVVGKFVRELNTRLAEQKISLELTDTLIEHIVKKSDEQKMGARPVRRIINQEITTPLSKKILFDRLQPGLYRADLVDGKVVFESLTNIEKFPEISQDGLVIV